MSQDRAVREALQNKAIEEAWAQVVPQDLQRVFPGPGMKLLRRLVSLPDNVLHHFAFYKSPGGWILFFRGSDKPEHQGPELDNKPDL